MFQFVRRFIEPFGPEQTLRWSPTKWESWFLRAARLYYLASDPAIKRGSFAPFVVEPLSDMNIAAQLFKEVREFVPDAANNLSIAVARAVSTWSPGDGAPLVEFMLELLKIVGGYLPAERLHFELTSVVGRLGSPLSQQSFETVLDEVVECATGRLDTTQLRSLGMLIERCSSAWRISAWRAQFRLLSTLIQIEGLDNLFVNVAAVAPRMPEFVGNQAAKHLAADIFVDGLGLATIAKLMFLDSLSSEEEAIRVQMRHCIFWYRLANNGSHFRDKLTGDIVRLPHRESAPLAGGEQVRLRLYGNSLFSINPSARRLG
jgi:hypothetical protein